MQDQNGNTTCPFPFHDDKNASATWYEDHFKCHACDDTYDIIDHYQIEHSLSIGEAISKLCEENGIDNSYEGSKKYKPKVIRAKVNDDYQEKRNKFQNEDSFLSDSFFANKKIDEHIARNIYGCETTDSEILLHGHEVINNNWTPVYTKRRKLDLSMYDMNGSETKEIQIAGGLSAFYGLPSLYNQNGQEKRIALICEGQLDALRLATELQKVNLFEQFAVLSVPTGGASLDSAWRNTPFFRKWFERCDSVIILPDADSTGKKMLEQAKECFCIDKTYWVDLTKVTGIRFAEKHGADVTDVFDKFNLSPIDLIKIKDHLPVEGLQKGSDIDVKLLEDGIASGFVTHDFNDSGLKAGCLTVLSGRRGGGKTTLAKQVVMCAAQQDVKSFCYFGESDVELEKGSFARMVALDGEISYRENLGGRRIYKPDPVAVDRYDQKYGDKIYFFCTPKNDIPVNIFQKVIDRMKVAVKRGCYLFLVDNLMLLTKESGSSEFEQQAKVTMALKKFALDHGVHIILVAHPKNGELKVSGSMEIEQRADTILHYVRVNNPDLKKMQLEDGIPEHEGENISAIILNDKVRNDGESRTIFLEWDGKRGVVMEVTATTLPERTREISQEYYDRGWFSRPSKKFTQTDHPPQQTI